MKGILIVLTAVLSGFISEAAAQGTYVRKQLEPDFFIPASAKPKPEKLPMPRYLYGEEETIKNAKPEPEPQRIPAAVAEEPNVNNGNVLDGLEQTPDYQQKFDDYSNDLDHISRTGELPANPNLEQDLSEMNSSGRRVIEKRTYQPRNAKQKFDKALEDSLNSD